MKECGKRFWSTIKKAVELNRKAVPLPPFVQNLDALPYEVVRVDAVDDEEDAQDGEYIPE